MVRFFTFFKVPLILMLFSSIVFSQDIDQQLSFKLSNDKFADKDQYFTNGLYLEYQRELHRNFILPKTDNNRLQLNISLGNEIYSPTSISSISTSDFDRPFAGWLFGKVEVGSLKERSSFFLGFETGITGEESQAGTLQIALHDFFGIDSRPTWVEEIEFKWLFNLKTVHTFDLTSNTKNALQYRISSSLGTKDIYLENDISYYFGKLNPFQNSSRIGIVNTSSTKEFFGYVSIGYKYTAHNTLIQGSIFSEDVFFTSDITNHILKAAVGAVLQAKQNTFKVIYNFNTKETPRSTSHIYGSLVYARRF